MVNFKENEELKTLNHSCAHLMAQAILGWTGCCRGILL